MLDVIMPTVDDRRTPGGLRYINQPYRLLTSTQAPWARAANALLDQTEHDVLHIDDDVELLPDTLDLIKKYYDQADIFGMSLLTPNDPRGWAFQSAGHALLPSPSGGVTWSNFNAFGVGVSCLVAHAGASCMYIKRSVVQAGIRFIEGWDGIHHEDVPFCLSAWLAGFKVARLAGCAIHYAHPIGAGKTRGSGDDYFAREAINSQHLAAWMDAHDVAQHCRAGHIPLGVWTMDGTPWALDGSGADRAARQ